MYPIIVKKVFGKKQARVEEERKDWKDVCPSEIWHEIWMIFRVFLPFFLIHTGCGRLDREDLVGSRFCETARPPLRILWTEKFVITILRIIVL